MTLWLVANITTSDRIRQAQVIEAATCEAARDQYVALLGPTTIRPGVFVAAWRLGNYPRQWLATFSDPRTPASGITCRDLGRTEIETVA